MAATTVQTRGITVVGQGKASAQPDVVRAHVGVEVISMARAPEMGGGGGPIAPGELELTAQIQVTYEIQ